MRINVAVKISLVVIGAICIMAATILGAVWVSHSESRKAAEAQPKCPPGNHKTHEVVFKHDEVVPAHIDAQRCDKLVITNSDNLSRYVAFGEHDRHVAYDGVTEMYLAKEASLELDLIQAGTFTFHDHLDEEVGGTFTVRED